MSELKYTIYKKQIVTWNEVQKEWYCSLATDENQELGFIHCTKLSDMKKYISKELEAIS